MKTVQLKYSRFFSLAPLPYAILLPDGRLLKANRPFAELLGKSTEDLPRRPLGQFLAEGDRQTVTSLLGAGGGQTRLQLDQGEVHASFLFDAEFQQYYVWLDPGSAGSSNSVAPGESSEAPADLVERIRIYENIIQNNWDAIIFTDLDGRIQFLNRAGAKLYGYRPEELVGQNLSMIHADSDEKTAEMMKSLRETGSYRGNMIHRKKDSGEILCNLNVSMVYDPTGHPLGLYANCKDVTREKQAENILQQSQERDAQEGQLHERLRIFQNIIENNYDAIVFSDLSGQILFANRQAGKMYGYRTDDLIGKNIDLFDAPGNDHAGAMVAALKEVGGWSGEIRHRQNDGTEFHILYTVSMIFDRDGRPSGLVSSSKDITERIIAEAEAREKTSELIRMKDSFLHELEAQVEERTRELNAEKEKTDELLLNILPRETAQELKTQGAATPMHYDRVSILFADFAGFTAAAEKLSPNDLIQVLGYYFSHFDEIIAGAGLEKIKTIGDAYMCAGGVPQANESNPMDAVRVGLAMQEFMTRVSPEILALQGKPWGLRIGIHTGPVVAGVVGKQRFAYDIWGDAVNIASRMESSSEAGRVNISETTHQLVNEHFDCTERGKIEVKSIGPVNMFFVNAAR